LISLTSLIPVISITGNSKGEREAFSFARYPSADSFGGLAGIEPRTRRSGHVRRGAALAGFRTVNLTAKSVFAFVMLKYPPCDVELISPKIFCKFLKGGVYAHGSQGS
jgi:hypothetical protein